MRGLILAAGRGRFTQDDLPPAMTRLAGRTLIERQIAALRAGGATEIGVVRGYRAEAIGVAEVVWFEHPRWAQTGAVIELCTAAEWLRGGTVIVSDANIFFRHELVHALGTVRGALVVGYDRQWRTQWERRFADLAGHVEAFRRGPAGNLLAIGGAADDPDNVQGQPLGLLKVTPIAWQAVETLLAAIEGPAKKQLDIPGLLQRLLAEKSTPIGTVGTDGQCGRIDRAADVALYEEMVAGGALSLEG